MELQPAARPDANPKRQLLSELLKSTDGECTATVKPRMRTRCMPMRGFNVEHGERGSGGADRDRTGDLLLAKQALSQLSYSPSRVMIPRRLNSWWVWMDLNHRPHAYQACALTS